MFYLVPITLLLVAAVLLHIYTRKTPRLILHDVKPVDSNFDWNCAPRKIRPFVGKKTHNVTMAIQNIAKMPEDWLLLESSYLDATNLRRRYTEQYEDHIMFAHDDPRTTAAVREFYELAIGFMCQRYPQYFTRKGNAVHNSIRLENIPFPGSKEEPMRLLNILTSTIEEDILIMLKDDPLNPEEEYILRANITGFPAGFDPAHNFNKPISFIHEPVPQYKTKLKVSMKRFFNRLEPKDLWMRYNWSVQTHKSHFNLHSNHAYGEKVEQLSINDIDFDEGAFLRCERQILTRLPRLRANIMTVRTYLTPLKQIKEEGLGQEMCIGIDGLPDDLAYYKRRDAWGPAVKEYMSS